MERVPIDSVRRFNRVLSQRVGALDEAYLSRDRPLGLARVLWEVGPDGSEVRTLRARLALDSGYLSRQLRRLETDGLVNTRVDGADGRVRTVRLTAAGIAERAVLDRSSDELATSILDPLSVAQRDRLVAAMAEVERLLLATQVDGGFDPARSISSSDEEMTPPRGLLVVATVNGVPVGCGALKLHPETATAEVKRMWTAPDARGLAN